MAFVCIEQRRFCLLYCTYINLRIKNIFSYIGVMSFPARKHCCDPLKLYSKVQKKDLRPVSKGIIAQHTSLSLTCSHYLCTKCRKELRTKLPEARPPSPTVKQASPVDGASGDVSNVLKRTWPRVNLRC